MEHLKKIEWFRRECPICSQESEIVSESDFTLHLRCADCGVTFSRSKLDPMDKKAQKEFLDERIQELTKTLDTLTKFYDTESDLTPHKAVDDLHEATARIAAAILRIKVYILWLNGPKKWYKTTQRRR